MGENTLVTVIGYQCPVCRADGYFNSSIHRDSRLLTCDDCNINFLVTFELVPEVKIYLLTECEKRKAGKNGKIAKNKKS